MRHIKLLVFFTLFAFAAFAQTPKTYTSSEILQQLKKLNVLGSVLYIAAHPDDENTRLLAYLANEKLYRTGYLSLTRGDGGQNLIGDEQGIDLGLIRTQELLAARRIDGAEQFFSRAFDFGFCKSPEEALATWGHDKILSDVVWVIRKFKPDVIIARFPEDSRAGHGHHAASGILAREAYDAAADPTKFPEQLTNGVTVWQAKRMLWNTFNFGGNSTQNETQFKMDVGMYNPLLGKSYGEIAALSRSQHKSQGFGVPAQRGTVLEYFETIKGDKPVTDLMDGVNTKWERLGLWGNQFGDFLEETMERFDLKDPSSSTKQLLTLNRWMEVQPDSYWKKQKQQELKNLIENTSGLFLEAIAAGPFAVLGDSMKLTLTANNRLGAKISSINVKVGDASYTLKVGEKNTNSTSTQTIYISTAAKTTQPYWLENPMEKGSFNVTNQQLIGQAENTPLSVDFVVRIDSTDFTFSKPIRYKYTDPVKGEIYQPVNIIPAFSVRPVPALKYDNCNYELEVKSFADNNSFSLFSGSGRVLSEIAKDVKFGKNETRRIAVETDCNRVDAKGKPGASKIVSKNFNAENVEYSELHQINYDHIPSILYSKSSAFTSLFFDLKTVGKTVGYIAGAGDKVPAALEQMGYRVTMLKETDLTDANLKQFDAIVTGVRAYNTNDWMNNVYDQLMQYVKDGGVLLVQYNTSSQIGPVKAKIAPYPFNISRTRITDETATVNFLQPQHPALNYPNKITQEDFEGWVQERSIYHAEKIDSNYQRIFSMQDVGEKQPDDGSLIIANYGKGKFVYTGLVFFRELPAGVAGAYRLFANLLAPPVNSTAVTPTKDSKTKKTNAPKAPAKAKQSTGKRKVTNQ